MKVKILVLCGDYYHPAHIARAGLSNLTGEEFTFDWIEDAGDWSAELMSSYPLVVLTKSNNISSTDRTGWMTDAAQAAFAEYICRGSGLLAIHSGTAEYEDKPVLRGLLGGVFAHHPEQCPVTVTPRGAHPLAEGCFPFTLRDEHYFMTVDDPAVDVFLTSGSEHGVQPAGWTRSVGSGRIAVLTPGHHLEVWLHPSFQALLRNTLRWCGKLG